MSLEQAHNPLQDARHSQTQLRATTMQQLGLIFPFE
jgi:hypothetical protein